MTKPEFIRTPNGPNLIIDENLKIGSTLVIPVSAGAPNTTDTNDDGLFGIQNAGSQPELFFRIGDTIHPVSGIPSGGSTGTALVKQSNTDYDTEWFDINTLYYNKTQSDAAYVKLANIGDGLTNTGGVISLGGAITQSHSVILDLAAGAQFDITDNTNGTVDFFIAAGDPSGGEAAISLSSTKFDNTKSSNLQISSLGFGLIYRPTNHIGVDVGIDYNITTANKFIVADDANHRGIEYKADYSTNYTTRSIPDVNWVNTNFVNLNSTYNDPAFISSLDFGKIVNAPTTISGYGITDFNTVGDARYEQLSNKGIANGYAPLNSSIKIDAAYLPSYVSDIVTVATFSALPAPGTPGFIYITADTNFEYRWNAGTSAYIRLVASPGTTDALAEGATNLYYTNVRVAAYSDAHYYPLYGNPAGYLTTETDPTVSSYAKSLTAFSVIKTSTDALYAPISGSGYIQNQNSSAQTAGFWINGVATVNKDNIQQNVTNGLELINNIASTPGAPLQYSPALYLTGTFYQGGVSRKVETRQYLIPGSYVFCIDYRYDGTGSYTNLIKADGNNLIVPGLTTSGLVSAAIVNSTEIYASYLKSSNNYTAYDSSIGIFYTYDKELIAMRSLQKGFSKPTMFQAQVNTLFTPQVYPASILITSQGTGYTSAPTITFSGGGTPTSQATGTAFISGGKVIYINITQPGNGYTSLPTISITGGGGTGVVATVLGVPLGVEVYNMSTNRTNFYTPTGVEVSATQSDISATDANVVHKTGTETIAGNKTWTGINEFDNILINATNLGGVNLSAYYGSNSFGKLLIGQNQSASLGETNFNSFAGTGAFAKGGFDFAVYTAAGVKTSLLTLNGNDFAAVFAGRVSPGIIDASSATDNKFAQYDQATKAFVSRTVAQVASDLIQTYPVSNSTTNTVTNKIKLTIDGVDYYVLASTSAI